MSLMPTTKNSFSWWSPGTVDFWLSHVRPHWSVNRPFALVKSVTKAASDAVHIQLKPNRNVRLPQPGEHLAVTVEIKGVRYTRFYSPTLMANGRIQITVKAVGNGVVSQFLNQGLQPGTTVELGEPAGGFSAADVSKPWLLLAAGSGITPVYSLLQQRYANADGSVATHLLYWNKLREQACYQDELVALNSQQENFDFQLHLTQQSAEQSFEREGRIDVDSLLAQIPNLANYQVFVCGPPAFIQAAMPLREHVADLFSETHQEVAAKPIDGMVKVTLLKSNKVVEVPAAKSLLDGLREAGVSMPHGCRKGVCNTCSCERVEGTTENIVESIKSSGNGAVKICVNQPHSDITLNA